MDIFNFKYLSLFTDQNKYSKINIKVKCAFTFVEVIMVMALISFLYVMTTKVIQHNLEKKAPTYVYYLYKNLENENNILTKKIIQDATNGSDTALKEKLSNLGSDSDKMRAILETMDAKKYGEYLSKDINTLKAVNSNDGTSEVVTLSEKYKDVEITNTNDMSRTFEFTISDDGTPSIKYTPSRNTNAMANETQNCAKKNLKNGNGCHYIPSTNISNLITPQKENQWYLVNLVSNTVKVDGKASTLTATVYNDGSVTNPDIEVTTSNTISNIPDELLGESTSKTLNVDSYSLKDKGSLFTSTNNINFHILTTKTETKPGTCTINKINNFSLTYSQDEVCPNTPACTINYNAVDNRICYFTQTNFLNYLVSGKTIDGKSMTWHGVHVECPKWSGKTFRIGDDKIQTDEDHYGLNKNDWISKYLANLPKTSPSSCNDRLNNINEQYNIWNKIYSKLGWRKKFFLYNVNLSNNTSIKYTLANSPIDKARANTSAFYTIAAEGYYTKWNNFFTKVGKTGTARQTIAALSGTNISEGSETYNVTSFQYPQNLSSGSKYPNHFIYVGIDTPFSKGEIGKNIFAFEQFGDKIIPVGYLANNANTPLKFDIITRNPETFKIEKVNYKNGTEKRPLTYCEAMTYLGEEFSGYCGCKWISSGSLLSVKDGKSSYGMGGYPGRTKYCDTSKNPFGCIIRPVKPSSSGRF